MKRNLYSTIFSFILVAGLFIGMFRGKEVRDKWVAKMKTRQEAKKAERIVPVATEVALDDIEMATYHS